jgi:hypothetical protein
MTPTYNLRRIGKKTPTGITSPVFCSLEAILKRDCPDSPYCVYSELIAVRLAQTINIPVAAGVLTKTESCEAYASIELASSGSRLPDLSPTQYAKAASQYPHEAAALLVFDIFIGNWDRRGNIKASFLKPHLSLLQGFDHEHALLSIEDDPVKSIQRLGEMDLIVTGHPFIGQSLFIEKIRWANRITAIDDALIHECCELKRQLGTVTTEMQKSLADALCKRKRNLRDLILKT